MLFLFADDRRATAICILKHHDQNQLPSSGCILLTTNESHYWLWWAPASRGLVAQTIFEVSCSNFIRSILSRISGACWKLLMTDVSPHCHTPCIIWFGKQHTVFCSISMSQTVCKQLVITQFSENHYFPMKCWTRSKLGFGMASAAPMMQCSSGLQVHMEERRRWRSGQVKRFLPQSDIRGSSVGEQVQRKNKDGIQSSREKTFGRITQPTTNNCLALDNKSEHDKTIMVQNLIIKKGKAHGLQSSGLENCAMCQENSQLSCCFQAAEVSSTPRFISKDTRGTLCILWPVEPGCEPLFGPNRQNLNSTIASWQHMVNWSAVKSFISVISLSSSIFEGQEENYPFLKK